MCDVRPMELKDTVELMASNEYKERFIAEYCQVKIRYENLSICWRDGITASLILFQHVREAPMIFRLLQ